MVRICMSDGTIQIQSSLNRYIKVQAMARHFMPTVKDSC